MSNQTDHTIVRLRVPPQLKEKIEKSAEANNRSQNAEMVARLEKSFEEKIPSLSDLSIVDFERVFTAYYQNHLNMFNEMLTKRLILANPQLSMEEIKKMVIEYNEQSRSG